MFEVCILSLLLVQEMVNRYIESLPVPGPGDTTSPSCHNHKLLEVKATSQALLACLQATTHTLQQVAEHQIWVSGSALSADQ